VFANGPVTIQSPSYDKSILTQSLLANLNMQPGKKREKSPFWTTSLHYLQASKLSLPAIGRLSRSPTWWSTICFPLNYSKNLYMKRPKMSDDNWVFHEEDNQPMKFGLRSALALRETGIQLAAFLRTDERELRAGGFGTCHKKHQVV
jgi:hypothetical protein